MSMSKIGFIGTGNMGGALALAVAKAGQTVYLSDHSPEKATVLQQKIGPRAMIVSNEVIIAECDMIFLGVKPQMMAGVMQSLQNALSLRTTPVCFVSMAAGVSVSAVETLCGKTEAYTPSVIRIMPNTPVAVGEGMVPYCIGQSVTAEQIALFRACVSCAGTVDEIPERLMDAASAVSGCGPAFVCLFIEALADGGVRCGLPRKQALLYAMETVKGTAALMETTGQHPGQMKDAVCSPGGTTIEGVAALEANGFRSAAMEAVTAAYRRTLELKK